MERRVTKVELRPINLLTDAQIAGAVAEDEQLDGGPDSVVSLNAPHQYKPITDGYYYGSNIAGKPRVELYFNGDPGLSKDKTIRISGINKLFKNSNNTGPIDFDISKDYKVIEVDEPPYDTDRNTYNGKRDTPDESVTSTATFNPSTGNEYNSKRKLAVKARISTVQATTNIATIVFSESHYFEENQIIYVDLPDTSYFGIDGLFRIDEVVNSTTIKYAFDASLPEPINLANITEERYVHAVAQSAIRDGATWFDTSQNPDVAYVWDDYRWVLFGSSNVADDDMPPAPITNLTATDKNATPSGSAEPRVEVTLEWDAPTKNEDGSPLVDLYGYKVQYRQYEADAWKTSATVTENTWSRGDFLPAKPAFFRVFAVDSGLNQSDPVEIRHTTSNPQPEIQKPKAPAVTSYLGTIKVSYDDLSAFGFAQPPTAKEIEVYFSQQSGFTPGPTNYYGKFPANAGSYIIIPGTELTDGVDYYVKLIVRDVYGNISAPSEQVSIRAKLSDIVTYDMIDVGTLTGQVIIGLDMRTSSNPSVNGGIIMNQQGMTAYNASGNQTFRIAADTGAVTIGEYLRTDQAAGIYLGKNVADGLYATKPSQGQFITDITAGQIFLSQTSASTNYITKLDAGTLYVGKGKTAADINSNSTTISGGKITTGSIDTDQLAANAITASKIEAGAINASKIVATGIFGRTIGTATSGRRIIMSSDGENYLRFNSSTDTTAGQIVSDGGDIYFNKNSGSSSGGLRLTSTIAELSTGAQGPGFCGVKTAYVSLSSGQVYIGRDAGSGSLYLSFPTQRFSSGGDRYMIIDYAGRVKYLSSFPSNLSDLRLKNLTNDAPLGIDFISKLNPVSFTWKPETKLAESNVKQFGLVAQEVEQALVESGISISDQQIVTQYGDDSYLDTLSDDDSKEQMRTINYTSLVPVLIKSTQELLAEINLLKSEIAILKEGTTNGS
jgi:hypothetical protein